MTRDLRSATFRENYSSSGGSLLNEFYIPALSNALRYDRATGYFTSAILALAPVAFSEFAAAGGKMRLLCSPHLSEADANAIRMLVPGQKPLPLAVAATSLAALAHGSDLEKRAVACLRALIDADVLQIRFVTSGRSGLFHDKIGVFADSVGNKLSFIGSANETAAAWSGFANHEQIETFRTWLGDDDSRRCTRHEDQFDETWDGYRRGLTVTSAEDAADLIRATITETESLADITKSLRAAVDQSEFRPDVIPLRSYQTEVLDSWASARYKGIVAFATGGGKTRTAIEAARRWTANGRPVLILVPSAILHEQWALELRSLLPNAAILMAGAGHSKDAWIQRLADYSRDDPDPDQRIVLATYQTASTDSFIAHLRDGEHLLLIADEVHRIGASDTSRILQEVRAGGLLGLSATPQRYGDPRGTQAITEYFGDILDPAFSLRDALDAQVLVPYDYDFVTCQLSDEEMERWVALTADVAQETARHDGALTDLAMHLLRQRARVAKRAAGKAPLARRVLEEHFTDGDRWLVYCNDVEHLTDVRAQMQGIGLDLMEYHSRAGGDRDTTLSYFTQRGGVLLAIKCLDEGVDIPLINRALILASSSNPREYIQRRGRVLRRTPGKYSAQIFDAIVLGNDGKPITPNEARRALEFAADARNEAPRIRLESLLPDAADEPGMVPTDIEED